jgi:hypothetical protein
LMLSKSRSLIGCRCTRSKPHFSFKSMQLGPQIQGTITNIARTDFLSAPSRFTEYYMSVPTSGLWTILDDIDFLHGTLLWISQERSGVQITAVGKSKQSDASLRIPRTNRCSLRYVILRRSRRRVWVCGNTWLPTKTLGSLLKSHSNCELLHSQVSANNS